MIQPILYEGDPASALQIDTFAARIRKDLKQGLIPTLIDKYFLQNFKKTTLRFNPDLTLNEKHQNEETAILTQMKKILDKSDLEKIQKDAE